MILVIKVFQIIDISIVICNIVLNLFSKKSMWNYLRIAHWVFYFCGIASYILSFGLIAIIETNEEERYGIGTIFLIACIACVVIMLVQKIWCVRYNSEILIFRNSIGIKREYRIKDLTLIDGNRLSRIFLNEKEIISWDTLIMNAKEDIAISKFFHSNDHIKSID